MRLLSKLSFLFVFTALIFASCDRENFDNTTVPDPGYEPEVVVVNNLITALQTNTEEGLELGCFSIDFSFELVLEDGSTIEVFTVEEFEALASPDSELQVVDFVFPLNITLEDGESTQVDNNMELGMLFASCIPEDGWEETTGSSGGIVIPAFLFQDLCFDLVYPVALEDADGNSYVAASEVVLIDLIVTVPSLAFTLPLTVTNEDGEEVVIESVAGFYNLYYDCDGVIPPGTEGGIEIDLSELDSANCDFEELSLQYPYTVVTDDGETITVVDENQEAALILSGVHYTIQYPFTLVDADGQEITINDDFEFIEYILPCLITVEPVDVCDTPAHILLYFNQSCGVVNYPNQLTAGGITYEINSMEDYFVVYNQYNWDEIEIIYPISVTISDGTVLTFNSDAEVCAHIEGC